MITDSGDTLWLDMFRKTLTQIPLSAATKESIEKVLVFRHRKEIGRVILISTPHRGANLAQNCLGRIASSVAARYSAAYKTYGLPADTGGSPFGVRNL